MTDTIMGMELRLADVLKVYQLMEGDIIKIEGEYFTVDSIHVDEGYHLTLINDYEEKLDITVDDEEEVELFVYVD